MLGHRQRHIPVRVAAELLEEAGTLSRRSDRVRFYMSNVVYIIHFGQPVDGELSPKTIPSAARCVEEKEA
jgi:hypothetical protein